MKKFLYAAFLIAYLFLSLLTSWLAVDYYKNHVREKLTEETAANLYRQAVAVSSAYGTSYYNNPLSWNSVQANLNVLGNYLSSTIWILDMDGNLLISSDSEEQAALPLIIEAFDPTDMGTQNYMIGDYYGYFEEEQLTVLSTITSDLDIRGYVVIHVPTSQIDALAAEMAPPRYVLLLLSLGTSLVLFVLLSMMLLKPIR